LKIPGYATKLIGKNTECKGTLLNKQKSFKKNNSSDVYTAIYKIGLDSNNFVAPSLQLRKFIN